MANSNSSSESSVAPTKFQSLIERSINAWNTLKYVAQDDKADAFKRHAGTLRSLKSLVDLLETRGYWFFQLRESFMRQNHFMKWDPKHLDEYILLPIDYGFANNKDCFFVSHYWHTMGHPDPEGKDMSFFRTELKEEEWSYIWLDWTCMPQVPRTDAEYRYFKRMLRCIPMVVRDCAFMWKFPRHEPRAWVLFEVAEFILCHAAYSNSILEDDVKPFVFGIPRD